MRNNHWGTFGVTLTQDISLHPLALATFFLHLFNSPRRIDPFTISHFVIYHLPQTEMELSLPRSSVPLCDLSARTLLKLSLKTWSTRCVFGPSSKLYPVVVVMGRGVYNGHVVELTWLWITIRLMPTATILSTLPNSWLLWLGRCMTPTLRRRFEKPSRWDSYQPNLQGKQNECGVDGSRSDRFSTRTTTVIFLLPSWSTSWVSWCKWG